MKGIEAHFTGRLSRDAEQRTTKAGKPMVMLTAVVNDPGTDDAVWITILAFEDLAQRLAGLPKGTELYARGRLKAEMYCPEGGEPRVSLTLLASHVEPLVLERKARKRPATVFGDSEPRKPSTYTSRRPATAGAGARFEPFDDDL